ncbi:hypothetical protein [Streptomyces malaysiensis]|uniref:hypothetical protein n=1 Tax=Streptomyces malaysiensis TaxID=92644 RepID=UPI003CCD6677
MAGVMKMVLAMRHGVLRRPCTSMSRHRMWTGPRARCACSPTRRNGRRRATRGAPVFSSFGASGTNAHVIVEQAPEEMHVAERVAGPEMSGLVPWVVSAKSEGALRVQRSGCCRPCVTRRTPCHRSWTWPRRW